MRLLSFDILRIVAVNCVIYIHTSQYYIAANPNPGATTTAFLILTNLSRFAVPFFFISSGYFLGKKIDGDGESGRTIVRQIKRVFILLASWSLVYAAVPTDLSKIGENSFLEIAAGKISQTGQWITANPSAFLFRSTSIHLWFLIALMLSCAVLLAVRRSPRFFFSLTVIMYFTGILGGAYSVTPIGIKLPFDTNLSFLVGAVYFALGYRLSKKAATAGTALILIMIFAGALLHLFETYYLFKHYNAPPVQANLVGTLFFGAGVGLLAARCKQTHVSGVITALSKYSPGVYLSHALAILYVIQNTVFWRSDKLYIFAAFNFGAYLASLALTAMLARIPYVRQLVL